MNSLVLKNLLRAIFKNLFRNPRSFYLVDRRNSLSEGLIMDLVKYNDITPSILQNHLNEMFPNGVTNHGNQYFAGSNSDPKLTEPQLEVLAEYIRRAHFSDLPSRFQSIFAVDRIELAKEFANIYGQGKIWEVEAKEYFKADMALLLQQPSTLGNSYQLNEYWKGSSSDTPFWEYLLKPPVKVIREIK